MKTPFPHQEKCLTALFDYFEKHTGNPVAVVPVGGGKSLLQAEFCKRAIAKYPETKFAIVTHVTELLLQIHQEFLEQWPEADVSFYADKLGHKNLSGKIILGSIQSIYKKGLIIPGGVDILIVDESHLISTNEDTMYRKFISDLKAVNPILKVIGFTGTNFRGDSGLLTEGEGRLFTDVAYQIPMLYLIEKGYLCPLVTPTVKTKMSVEGVKLRGGDYIESMLQKAIDKPEVTKACVDELIEHGKDRKKWLIFTSGVEHCEHVRDEIRSRGISCEMVTGETPSLERASIVKRYKEGDLQCLVCVAVFTTGFNNPAIDLIAFMRPTRSPVLYVQCAGRGLRTSPGKKDCMVLDFGGVIDNLGPVDTIDARMEQKRRSAEAGEAPVKVCPKCEAVCFAGVRQCEDCGHFFPPPEVKISLKPSSGHILSVTEPTVWHKIVSVEYTRHKGKDGKKDTLRAKYISYGGEFSQFLCPEHIGWPREKFCQWHRKRLPEIFAPNNIDEALKMEYPAPSEVGVKKNGKYFEIVDFKFEKEEEVKKVMALEDYEFIPF